VTEQDQPWQSLEGNTDSPSSDPLSKLPSGLGGTPQEAKPRETASPDTWKDMVRSVAVSTADLWQEVLDRLARLEANQEALVNSLQEFRAAVIEQQSKPQLEAHPPSLSVPPPLLDRPSEASWNEQTAASFQEQNMPTASWPPTSEPFPTPTDIPAPSVQQEVPPPPVQEEAPGQEEAGIQVPFPPEPPAPPERQWKDLPPVASLGSEELAGVLASEFGPYATQSDHGSPPNQVKPANQVEHWPDKAAPGGPQEAEQTGQFQQDPVLSALFAEPSSSQEVLGSAQASSPPPPPPDFSWSQGAVHSPGTEQSPGQASPPPPPPDFSWSQGAEQSLGTEQSPGQPVQPVQPGQPVPETTGSFQSPAIPVDYDPNDFPLQTEHPAPQVGPEQLPPPEVAQRAPDPPITPDFFARVRKGIMGH